MNITSKRLDKIKKTKNQSKRRIHYKNKKKNGKEKNRRKNRKYNKSTGKYRKTHKQKKRAYDLKNKSLKFKENQPGKKPAPLKIMTTDKPVETVQTGGAPVAPVVKDKLQNLIERAKNAITGYHKKQDSKIDELKNAIYNEITQDDKFKALFLILKQATDEGDTSDDTVEKLAEKWYRNANDENKNNVKFVINKLKKVFGTMSVEQEANYENLADIKQKFLLMIKKIQYNDDGDTFSNENDEPKTKANIMRLYKLLMRYEIQSFIKKSIGWSDPWNRKFIGDFEKIIKSLKEKLTEAKKAEANAQKDEAEEAKKEEEAKNIKANIKTPEFNKFVEDVKKGERGAYRIYLTKNSNNIINNAIVKGEREEREEKEEKEGEEEGEEGGEEEIKDDKLVEIYNFLMGITEQDKIRQYLTGKYIEELKNFDAMIESIKNARFAQATYTLPKRKHEPKIMLVKPGVPSADTAVISTDTSDLKTTDALVDLGNFKKHVEVTENEMNRDDQPGAQDNYEEGKKDGDD